MTDTNTITVRLNGQLTRTKYRNLVDAVSDWNLSEQDAAVAVNEVFIPRSERANHSLVDGDTIELLTPMSGG